MTSRQLQPQKKGFKVTVAARVMNVSNLQPKYANTMKCDQKIIWRQLNLETQLEHKEMTMNAGPRS